MATFGLAVPYIGGKSKNGNYLSQIIAKNGNIWTRLATEHSWDEASLGTRLTCLQNSLVPRLPAAERTLGARTIIHYGDARRWSNGNDLQVRSFSVKFRE